MRAAKIENGVVTNLWEVPSLDCYGDLYHLVEAPDGCEMGATWNGDVFINPPPPPTIPPTYAELRTAAYPPLAEQVGAMWKGGEAAAAMAAQVQAVKDTYPKP